MPVAAIDDVAVGSSTVTVLTLWPFSASRIPVDNPITPAPTTVTALMPARRRSCRSSRCCPRGR